MWRTDVVATYLLEKADPLLRGKTFFAGPEGESVTLLPKPGQLPPTQLFEGDPKRGLLAPNGTYPHQAGNQPYHYGLSLPSSLCSTLRSRITP